MKSSIRQTFGPALAKIALLLAVLSQNGMAQPNFGADSTAATVAILPFKNLSADVQAKAWVMPAVYDEMGQLGFSPVSADCLDAVLRRHRIRETGQIGWEDAQRLWQGLGARWILLGSIDQFEAKRPIRAGFSMRLLDALTGDVVWADARYATGQDYVHLLGLGAIVQVERLAGLQLQVLLRSLGERLTVNSSTIVSGVQTRDSGRRIFIVPFENTSATSGANLLVDHALVGLLEKRGFNVIEPGLVAEQLRAREVTGVGQIDLQTLKALGEHFVADYCLTGMLSVFVAEVDPDLESAPEIRIEARLLDAESGDLIMADAAQHSGDDYALIFGLGTIHSTGQLVQRCLNELIENFGKRIERNS
jgi:TolB-like protein